MKASSLAIWLVIIVAPQFAFADSFYRHLTHGSTGYDVSALQEILIAKGYLSSQPTGYFGPLTVQAVKTFQKENGIEAMGDVGPQTRALLNAFSFSTSANPNQALIDAILAQIKILQAKIAALLAARASTTTAGGFTGSGGANSPTSISNYVPSGGGGTSPSPTPSPAPSPAPTPTPPPPTPMPTPSPISQPDIMPPSVTITAPTTNFAAGTTQTALTVSTNENATCNYSSSATFAFANGTVFSTTGALSHTTTITGLTNGSSSTYYVKCKDSAGNISGNASVTFSVATPQQQPTPTPSPTPPSNPPPPSTNPSANNSYTLSVTTSAGGTITSNPSGINCGTSCSTNLARYTMVALIATPASGYTFSGWGGACTGTGSCTVTMTAANSVTATFTASVSGMSMMPYVDVSKIPTGDPGYSDYRVRTASEPPVPTTLPAFRTVCTMSHMNFDDPIVFPGQTGKSHLHVFFGNSGTDAFSNPTSLRASGNSTCRGGIANRSAYWVPAMIDTRTGTPLKPRASNFYYKSSTTTTPTNQLHALPVGLVMIAGDSKATGPLPNIPELYHIAHNYQCVAPSGPSIDPMTSQSIPNCPVGSQLWMNVGFPSCWDGVHLDSADHKSHMAYAWRGVCPADHPIMIPDISFHIIYDVTEANAPLHWRLVSDNYDSSLPGGYSGHGDWMGAWDTSISDTWLKLCDNASLDCHSGLLGDGREIY